MTDFCSECGIAMAGSTAAASTPAAATPAAGSSAGSCSNCSEPHGPHDVFCENCGFDFSSGSLPDAAPEPSTGPAAAVAAAPASAQVRVSVDLDYFETVVEGGEVALPDPLPAPSDVVIATGKALIGRHSASRGIFPELDVEKLTEDPAVSSRHAMLHRTEEGTWEINDLGSTNGTRVGARDGDEIAAGTAHPIEPGVAIFVGAWTRIELLPPGLA